MARIMGIDTGGTFTDGVIIDPSKEQILCKSKVFTEKHDLISSVDACISNLMHSEDPGQIALVCISTTLATNAIVEGKKGRVALLLTGGKPEGKLPADICIELKGKLNIKGKEKEPLDLEEVARSIEGLKDRVDAVAISGYASVRNPKHELLVKQILGGITQLPVVCAHELSSELGYYDRTVTASLNAGLIPVIRDLIYAVRAALKKKGINVPVMIVKGDGSLMRDTLALDKPIETILSGPAASMIGGVYLTKQKNGLILDMGGTTTDTAIVNEGRVKIKNSGAVIGGWSPQVKAADIQTFGLGGDSRIGISPEGKLVMGPRKVMPLCVAGSKYPNLFGELREIASGERFEHADADCFSLIKIPQNMEFTEMEKKILHILAEDAHSLYQITNRLGKAPDTLTLERLESNEVIQRISLTPTDILHINGSFLLWNAEISKEGAKIAAKQMQKTLSEFLEEVTAAFNNKMVFICKNAIPDVSDSKKANAGVPDCKKANSGVPEFFKDKPMIAIGAPVKAWMPAVSKMLQASLIIPEHAEVANAIGAAAGQITESVVALIRPDRSTDEFILHAPWEWKSFRTLEEAVEYAAAYARKYAFKKAEDAGGSNIEVLDLREDIYVDDFNHDAKNFIEVRIKATAVGRLI